MATVIAMRALPPAPTWTRTPRPTLNLLEQAQTTAARQTEKVWRATALSVARATEAASDVARATKEAEIADFPTPCDDLDFYGSSISPNREWFAASCGYKRDQTLVVQSRDGAKWVLDFQDFLGPETPIDMTGGLYPKFWSADGGYLYFVPALGYSGGGNQCFPGFGEYGLFRLNLRNGEWVTLFPPTDWFPGVEIDFAPTGRRFAIATSGLVIEDLKTGDSIQVDTPFVQEMSWSPDGLLLAFSVANCGEHLVENSAVRVWDARTGDVHELVTADGVLLRPELWIDNTRLVISGEISVDRGYEYIIYEYDVTLGETVFTGTATPHP